VVGWVRWGGVGESGLSGVGAGVLVEGFVFVGDFGLVGVVVFDVFVLCFVCVFFCFVVFLFLWLCVCWFLVLCLCGWFWCVLWFVFWGL
ncbi:hypothetical protein, partial [Pseudomonas aeruginosa]|uniref:hypothetical protein n=1 Tax=Pseudomonas aeruginosa TaxID=287 RepID=UPI003CC65EED